MKVSKKAITWSVAALVVVAVVGLLGVRWWRERQSAVPEGIASGNGRLEAKLVDVAAQDPLRVAEVLVNEGDIVRPGQLLVKMDTSTLDAQLAEANATIAATEEKLAFARASIVKQRSELELANIEIERATRLAADGAGSQRELDTAKAELKTSEATLAEARAGVQSAEQQVEAARAQAAAVQTRIDDATLVSPVTGRVLYRLAEPGEVLAAGGKALTLVNLEDVYMEIFLPSEQASGARIGAEGRITLDYEPDRALPAAVTFVSPEAQFTPKQVETKSERDKLMFRVKLQVPPALASQYLDQVKTGVRGVGYLKLRSDVEWPERLQNLVTPGPAGPPVGG